MVAAAPRPGSDYLDLTSLDVRKLEKLLLPGRLATATTVLQVSETVLTNQPSV